ncbi:MAG: TonB family protein [Microcoleaceae cyanobacterium]
MSLSETCIQQREQDARKIKLWLLSGLMASALLHVGLLALAFSGLLDSELEIPEEDAIEFIVIEEEIIEPELEEIPEEPEPIVEEIPEEIIEPEPIVEEIPEEIVEEIAPVEPTLEPQQTTAFAPPIPAEAEQFSEPEPLPEPIVEEPLPEPEPVVEDYFPEPEPIPEPVAEDPFPEPVTPVDEVIPLTETWEEPIPEPVAAPEPFVEEPLPEPVAANNTTPEPMSNILDGFEADQQETIPAPDPFNADTSPFGEPVERSQPTQAAVPQPGAVGSPGGMGDSFEGIGSGETGIDSSNPGQGDFAFGDSPLQQSPGGSDPGRPEGTDEGMGNDLGNETDTAFAGGGGSWACSSNCDPGYPRSLRDLGIEGTATVRVFLEASGRVTQQELVNSSGNTDIDQAALDAASRMRFDPIDGGGSSSISVNIQFQLN